MMYVPSLAPLLPWIPKEKQLYVPCGGRMQVSRGETGGDKFSILNKWDKC